MDELMRLGAECAARIGEYDVIMIDLTMDGVGTSSTFTWGVGALAAYPERIDDEYLVLIQNSVTGGVYFVPTATKLAASFDIDHPNASVVVVNTLIISRRPNQ